MTKLDLMKKGYEISIKNLEATVKDNKPNAYFDRQKESLSESEYKEFTDLSRDQWVRFGALFPFMFHPAMGYKTLKIGFKSVKYNKKNNCGDCCNI